ATLKSSQMTFDRASGVGGVFCAATHYWELDVPSQHAGDPTVGEHLRPLVDERVYGYASGDPSVAGGAERYVWLLTRALVASGWSATVGVRHALKRGERVRIACVEFV